SGPVAGQTVSPDGRTVTFVPVRDLHAGEAVTFRVTLRSQLSGQAIVGAEAASRTQRQPTVGQAKTSVQ
ncbi:MAG: hypothetical protein KDA41_14195, partial [Planctomycetales bacterium]|nr:hypothetical protein [Planctomycetales bacterium]